MDTLASPSTSDLENPSGTTSINCKNYKKGGTLGIKGGIYQLKWLMFFLFRGLQKRYKFRLATEMDSAEKFDDIFFEYLDEKNEKVYRFLQIKHKDNETDGIKLDDLLNGDGDFALLKYFNSYKKIKQKAEFKDGVLRDIIICTNRGFGLGSRNCDDTFEKIEDDILNVEYDKAQVCRFKENFPLKESIYEFLRNASELNKIAKKLADCVLYSKPVEDHRQNSEFKAYSGMLVDKVFDKQTKCFLSEFLMSDDKELSEDLANFRSAFRIELERETMRCSSLSKKKKHKKPMNLLLDLQINVLEQIKDVKIQLSKNFGKNSISKTLPTDSITDEEIREFLSTLVFAVNQPNEEHLGNIIRLEFKKEFNHLKSDDDYNRFFVDMLDWMKEKEGRFLSYEDAKAFLEEAKRGFSIRFNVQEPVEFFTGRTKELQELHAVLQKHSDLVVVSPCITGLGGVGKTEFVRKYIEQYCQFFEHNIIWINAESRMSIENSFISLAKDKLHIVTEDSNGKLKDIRSIVDDVYRYFVRSKSLFIFDNASSLIAADGIGDFLPNVPRDASKPYVVITSRDQEWKDKKFKQILLDVFSKEEAVQFIKDFLNLEERHEAEILELASTLQFFPLALYQAVSYIKQSDEELKYVDPKSDYLISDYLKEFDVKSKELLNFRFFNESSVNVKTTYTTWNITMDKIRKSSYGAEAVEILNIISYFAPDNIPSDLFLCYVADKRQLGGILRYLKKYSMVALSEGCINVHRLVQIVNRINLKENFQAEIIIKKSVEIITKTFPCGQDLMEDCFRKRKLLPHLQSILTEIDQHENLQQEFDLERLLNCLADAYGDLGFALEEKHVFERLLSVSSNLHGESSWQVALALIGLGTAWGDLGDFEKQKNMVERALDILDNQPLDNLNLILRNGVYYINGLVKLSTACSNLENYDLAKTCLSQALLLAEKLYGREHYEYATILKHLGVFYGKLRDHEKEKDLLEQALPILKAHYGHEHHMIGAVLGMLGAAYSDLGDQQKAISYLQESLTLLENYYGPNHFQVGYSLGDLGIEHWKAGRYDEAKILLEKNLSIFETHYGKDSNHLVAPLKNLSYTLGKLGYRRKQINLLERVLQIQEIHNEDRSQTILELFLLRLGFNYVSL